MKVQESRVCSQRRNTSSSIHSETRKALRNIICGSHWMSEACRVLGLFAMHDDGGRTKGNGEANGSISSSQVSNRVSSLDHLEKHLSSTVSVQNCTSAKHIS